MYVGSTEQSPVIPSLCPGILGLDKGLERAVGPCRTIAYVEIESFIVANLVAQMEAGLLAPAPIWSNVKTFDPQPFRNRIHGILGGYPCQPFSHAGERGGTEDPRHLWPYISKIIDATRPVFCFFENVAGHLSLGYDEVYRSLRDMGYRVEAGIFTAEEVGAPHERERIFILALDDSKNQRQYWSTQAPSWNRREPSISSKTMANSGNEGLQRDKSKELPGQGWRQERGTATKRCEVFPAGQGTFQYEWEEPRTIESSMVYTIDGYNFTEDLHRAIGNSVVEQTAQLAFLTLLDKHLKNNP